MLRFFRKIRRNLLQQSKVRTYMAYAIGEILLVVIGILIALAIDNYNDQRIIREKEQSYLLGLQNDFQISQKKLDNLIRINQQNYEGAQTIVGYMDESRERPSEERFSKLLNNTFASDISFNPNNAVLDEMLSSGSLKDISNPVLRTRLTNWVSTLQDIARQEEELSEQRNKVLDLIRTNKYSLRTILELSQTTEETMELPKREKRISNLELLNSLAFENNILLFMVTTQATTHAHYQPLKEEILLILSLISGEIRE